MLYCRSVSHHNAPLAIRERLDLSVQEQEEWLSRQDAGELVVLSTCNRLELYAELPSASDLDVLWQELLSTKLITTESIAPYVSSMKAYEAASHLFHVAGSLRSMALGESQILGQVSDAFEVAQHCETIGHHLSLLFRAAIHAAKRIRHETNIGYGNISVSSLGISKMEALFGSLDALNILVIGAGEMGQSVLKGLAHRSIPHVHLVSRTFEKAKQVAATWDAEAHPLTHLKESITDADIVFTTSSAPYPILSKADIEPIMKMRDQRPLSIVDIAVPRDVARDVAELAGVTLFDLDALQEVIESNHLERERAIPDAKAIINEDLVKFWQEYNSLEAVPTIRQIRDQANQIREKELQRIANKLDARGLTEVTPLIEEFSYRFMNKILHHPTHNLRKKAGHSDSAQFNSVARDLFGIENN